jgi:hypothetical protein
MLPGMNPVMLATGGDNHVVSMPAVSSVVSAGSGVRTTVFRLTNGGDIEKVEQGIVTNLGAWIDPKTEFGNYEALATVNSGSLTSGTTGSAVNLGTTRSWACTDAVVDATPVEAVLTIIIRRVSDAQQLASGVVSLSADRS